MKSESSQRFSYENTVTERANMRPVEAVRRDERFRSSRKLKSFSMSFPLLYLLMPITVGSGM